MQHTTPLSRSGKIAPAKGKIGTNRLRTPIEIFIKPAAQSARKAIRAALKRLGKREVQ
jgi:hypothetical protein